MGPPHLSLSPMRLCRNGRNAMFVILNPSPVILSEAKNLDFLAQGRLREESHGINKLMQS